jgi:riboflavin synthase
MDPPHDLPHRHEKLKRWREFILSIHGSIREIAGRSFFAPLVSGEHVPLTPFRFFSFIFRVRETPFRQAISDGRRYSIKYRHSKTTIQRNQRLFTGLVETMGEVTHVAEDPAGRRFSIDLPEIRAGLSIGDSIAINGCCLTAIALSSAGADFEAGPETLVRTNLGELRVGHQVNLERALRADSRLGGHIVQGHIDGVGTVRSRQQNGEWETIWFEVGELTKSLVPKGSIAIDGVSLTVCDVTNDAISVMLIPHTLSVTTLGRRSLGDRVNIETDILGKYIAKMMEASLPGWLERGREAAST